MVPFGKQTAAKKNTAVALKPDMGFMRLLDSLSLDIISESKEDARSEVPQ